MHWFQGILTFLEEDLYLIKNSYLGIEVFYFGSKEQEDFFIQTIYQEKDRIFYAFAFYEEKRFFQDLLKITGIGPRTAFNLMKNKNLDELRQALEEGDRDFFKGLGKKTLEYLFLEFQKKIRKTHPKEEEILVLTDQLGLNKNEVLKYLKQYDLTEETEFLFKKILQDVQHVSN